MPNVRYHLKSTSEKNNETLIFLSFNYKNNRLRISTGISVKPKNWNSHSQSIKQQRGKTEEVDKANRDLSKMATAMNKAYEIFRDMHEVPTLSQLKDEYKNQLHPVIIKKQKGDFWELYPKFIESSIGRVVNDVIKDYRSLEKHLRAYETKYKTRINFNFINYNFYQKFVHFLTYEVEKTKLINGKKVTIKKGLATNTVGKQIKNLKVFLNYCFNHGFVERFDISNFKSIAEETDSIYITNDELLRIKNADLSKTPELTESRDLFVLGCQIGLRSKDLFRLTPAMIENDMIRIRMHKTNKLVVIPLSEIAKEIIAKYNNDFPNKNNKNTFNSDLKKIGRIAEINSEIVISQKRGIKKIDKTFKKYELMSSHTCRRSFCTNQFLKGVPPLIIMKISGHKSEKTFLRYIKIDEEMAAKKMMEYWK